MHILIRRVLTRPDVSSPTGSNAAPGRNRAPAPYKSPEFAKAQSDGLAAFNAHNSEFYKPKESSR